MNDSDFDPNEPVRMRDFSDEDPFRGPNDDDRPEETREEAVARFRAEQDRLAAARA